MTTSTPRSARSASFELSLPQSAEGRAAGAVRAVYHRGDRIALLLADGAVLALAPFEARRIVRALGPNLAGCDVLLEGAALTITKEVAA